MTPFNLSLWGSLNPATAPILRPVSLSPLDVFTTIFVILGIPLAGLLLSRFHPLPARCGNRRVISFLIFVTFVALALKANWETFLMSSD